MANRRSGDKAPSAQEKIAAEARARVRGGKILGSAPAMPSGLDVPMDPDAMMQMAAVRMDEMMGEIVRLNAVVESSAAFVAMLMTILFQAVPAFEKDEDGSMAAKINEEMVNRCMGARVAFRPEVEEVEEDGETVEKMTGAAIIRVLLPEDFPPEEPETMEGPDLSAVIQVEKKEKPA